MEDVSKQCRSFISYTILYAVALYMLCFWSARLFPAAIGNIDAPVCVSGIFMLVTSIAIALIWKKVAISSPDSLPQFHMAVSGFRMLLALFTLLGCYLAVGRENMAPYIIVFMLFYFMAIIHYAIFFSRINNKK